MDKKKLEIIVIIILALVFIFILAGSFKKTRSKMPSAEQKTSQAILPEQEITPLFATRHEKSMEKTKDNKELAWGRDPFMLHDIGTGVVDTVENLKLMGITVGKNTKSMAIINDEIVSVGSKIGKFKIVSIMSNKVVVTDGEKNYDLKLSQ